jgi:ABC-2 type transport system permease protein
MGLYVNFFSMHLKSQMQYKTSFFFTTLGQFLVAFATFLSINFLFARFDSVGGFSYEEVLLCFAVMMMAFSASELIGRGFDRFPVMLGNGSFDRALVRPRNIIFQVLASQMEFSRLGRLVQAVAVFVFVIPRSGIDWTWDRVMTLALMIICGAVLFFGLFVVYAAISFFTVEGLEFMNILTHGGREFGRYPYAIYGREVLRFVTYVVPLALFQYYPLLYLLDIEQSVFYMFTPLLALLFIVPSYGFFRLGLRKYKSTGS